MKALRKFETIKLIGLLGIAVGALANAISNYAQSKEMEAMVEDKVQKALAEKEENEKE